MIQANCGNINSYSLVGENTKVTVSGSGNAYVYASEELDVVVSGSGSVAYKGYPKIINQ